MSVFAQPFADLPALNQVTLPDLWQQEAVAAFRMGKEIGDLVKRVNAGDKEAAREYYSRFGGRSAYEIAND